MLGARPGLRRIGAVALVAVVLASGCSSSDSAGGAEDRAATVIDRLAAAGIAVFVEPGDADPIQTPAEPVSPVQLLEWQVRGLAGEADGHAGFAAHDLDTTVGEEEIDETLLTPSQLIAGWARYGDTPAAEQAREILGDSVERPAEAVFPKLVLLLFTSDIAKAGAAPAEPKGGGSPMSGPQQGAAAQDEASTPCSSLVNWVDGIIARVFNAIGHLQAPTVKIGLGGWFDTVVNTIGKVVAGGVNVVIDGAHFVINKATRVLIAPIIGFFGRIAGIVGTIAQVGSIVRPWSPSLDPDPLTNAKAVLPAAGLPGSFTLSINLGGLDEWPPALADCAAQAGKPLPPLKPAGNPVTWKITGHDLVEDGERDSVLREDATAVAHYRTTQEEKFKKAKQQSGTVTATATVQRDDVTELEEAFVKLLDDAMAQFLPPIAGIVKNQLERFVLPFARKAFDRLKHLRDEKATSWLRVTYHVPDDDETTQPVPPPPPPTTGTPAACLPTGKLSAAARIGFQTAPIIDHGVDDIKLTCSYNTARIGKWRANIHILYFAAPPDQFRKVVNEMMAFTAAHGGPELPCKTVAIPGAQDACQQIHGVPPVQSSTVFVATEMGVVSVGAFTTEFGLSAEVPSLPDIVRSVAAEVVQSS